MFSEVTKVRRNLFTQEISPSKRPAKRGLPRSHSVSAVEGLQRKLDGVGRTRGNSTATRAGAARQPVPRPALRHELMRLPFPPSLWLSPATLPLGVSPAGMEINPGLSQPPFPVTPADTHLFYKTRYKTQLKRNEE